MNGMDKKNNTIPTGLSARTPFRRLAGLLVGGIAFFCSAAHAQQPLVRISEIEVHPQHLEAYKAILTEEAEASVRLEKGVVAIFPMFQRENPAQVRILEIYQDERAYRSHLETAHFLKYKTETLHMVKSLNLVDMDVPDMETAKRIFVKLKSKKTEGRE